MAYSKKVVDRFESVLNNPQAHSVGRFDPKDPMVATGMTGAPNSTLMGRFGDGSLAFYTDEDREEYARQSGPPGQGGSYKSSMTRNYVRKGGGKSMIGQGAGTIGESELKEIIASVLTEMMNEDRDGADAFNYALRS